MLFTIILHNKFIREIFDIQSLCLEMVFSNSCFYYIFASDIHIHKVTLLRICLNILNQGHCSIKAVKLCHACTLIVEAFSLFFTFISKLST